MFGGGTNNMIQMVAMINMMNMIKMFSMGGKSPLMMGGNVNNNPMQNLMFTMYLINGMMQRLSNATSEISMGSQNQTRFVGI